MYRFSIFLLIAFAIYSAESLAMDLPKGRSGKLLCVGTENDFNRTIIGLTNFNDDIDLNIDRFIIYDGNGDLIFDTLDSETDIPASSFKRITQVDSVLQPHQSAIYQYNQAGFPIPEELPFQFIIEWSADRRALALWGHTVRRSTSGDTTDFSTDVERHQVECSIIITRSPR